MDPLAEFVAALDRFGKPTLHWVVRWSQSRCDPVAAVWQITRSPEGMVRLLEIVALPSAAAARRILYVDFISSDTDRDVARCDAIRRLVPSPPTLREVLDSVRTTSGSLELALG